MRAGRLIQYLLLVTTCAVSQGTYGVRGVVRDGATLQPLVFATVAVAGTRLGTTTDATGAFALELPAGEAVLQCRYVGYRTAEINVSPGTTLPLRVDLEATDIALLDVMVYAFRRPQPERLLENRLSLQSEELRKNSAVIPDVLRSAHFLPGVSANNEFSARFNVRGGNQDENLILVNGTHLYDPYHIKEVPNASISIMMMDLVRSMDLMTGGFPARYGDKLSSVVNIEYRKGDRERYRGIATASLTNADLVAEGPLDNSSSFIIGARKSYFEYLLGALNRGTYHHPSFYDVQGVIDHSLSPGHTLNLKFLHAGDTYTQDPVVNNYGSSGDSLNNRGTYYTTLVALESVNILTSSTIVRTDLSFHDQLERERFWWSEFSDVRSASGGRSLFDSTFTLRLYRNDLRVRTMDLQTTLDHQFDPVYGVKVGVAYQRVSYVQDQLFQFSRDRYTNTVRYPDTTVSRELENILDVGFNNVLDARSWKAAGFVENILHLSDRVLLNAGARVDYFDLNRRSTWSPRVILAYRPSDAVTLRGAWGVYYQSPNYRQIASSVPSDTNTPPQKAIHYVVGIDVGSRYGPDDDLFFNIKIEGFTKRYPQLMSASLTTSGIVHYSRQNDARGSASGVDLHLTFGGPRSYGWISYGYLVAVQDILGDATGSYPRHTAQRHTFTAVGNLDLGNRWTLGGRLTYGSGYPYTPYTAFYDSTGSRWNWVEGPPNSATMPAYRRLDLRVSRDMELFGLDISAFADISNLLNFRNVQSFRYTRSSADEPVIEEVRLWPILGSLGVSVRF